MSVALTVTLLVLTITEVLPAKSTNCSSRNDGINISGGVCKADYSSRFNIDSKELMGTTCVSRNRGISKLLSARLKQALERMKQDFQQLQDLVDQEVALSDSESFGPVWRSSSFNVNRDYQKEQKSNGDKVARYYNDPPIGTNVREVLDDVHNQGLYHPQTNFYAQTGLLYDNSSKKIPDPLETRPKKGGIKTYRREPLSEYNPRTAYEQQRILADIRIEPEINDGSGSSADDVKGKNKYSEPEVPLPVIGVNPSNFGF